MGIHSVVDEIKEERYWGFVSLLQKGCVAIPIHKGGASGRQFERVPELFFTSPMAFCGLFFNERADVPML
jgi:hypothetical protein